MITEYQHTSMRSSENANVADYFKHWTTEEIKACLQKNRSGIITIFQNIQGDFNKSSAIRAHNAFLGHSVYIVGRRKYDKRGTVGTHHYENIYHADTLAEVIDYLHSLGYKVYAVDNIMEYNPKNILDEKLPYKSAFVFGEEGPGLSLSDINLCDDMIYIGMYGSVRSLNVASAAAVIEFEYARQWKGGK